MNAQEKPVLFLWSMYPKEDDKSIAGTVGQKDEGEESADASIEHRWANVAQSCHHSFCTAQIIIHVVMMIIILSKR